MSLSEEELVNSSAKVQADAHLNEQLGSETDASDAMEKELLLME